MSILNNEFVYCVLNSLGQINVTILLLLLVCNNLDITQVVWGFLIVSGVMQ